MKPRPPQPNWPEALTQWAVIEALRAAGWPDGLELSGAAKAAFVSEVSAYLRFRTIEFRELEAEARMAASSESAVEHVGRSDHWLARDSAETAEVAGYDSPTQAHTRGQRDAALQCLSIRFRQHSTTQVDVRQPAKAAPAGSAHAAAVTYWQAVARCRIPEGLFADAPPDGAISNLRAHRDLWWALFLQSLRTAFKRSDPAYCRLLEALPALREAATKPGQKFVLTALVQEWRQTHGARVGLLKDVHFPVIEQRAWAKHRRVSAWFDEHAPGYPSDAATRERAAHSLRLELARMLRERRPIYGNN